MQIPYELAVLIHSEIAYSSVKVGISLSDLLGSSKFFEVKITCKHLFSFSLIHHEVMSSKYSWLDEEAWVGLIFTDNNCSIICTDCDQDFW